MSAGLLLFLCFASCGGAPYPTPANHRHGNSALDGGSALGRACNEINPCPDLKYYCSSTGRNGNRTCACLFGSPDALGQCPVNDRFKSLGPCKTNEDCLVPDSFCLDTGLSDQARVCLCLWGTQNDKGGCPKYQPPDLPVDVAWPPVDSSVSYSNSYNSYSSSSSSSNGSLRLVWIVVALPCAVVGIVCRIMIRGACAGTRTRTIWVTGTRNPDPDPAPAPTPATWEGSYGTPQVGESFRPADDLPPSYDQATDLRAPKDAPKDRTGFENPLAVNANTKLF